MRHIDYVRKSKEDREENKQEQLKLNIKLKEKSTKSLSKKGDRSSKLLAIEHLSSLTNMSPTREKLKSLAKTLFKSEPNLSASVRPSVKVSLFLHVASKCFEICELPT